jgi:glutathione S-transferase
MKPIRLYVDATWMSPYSYTVFTALKEKEIPFQVHEVRFVRGEVADPEFAGKTYTDLIPMLQHGDHCISESLAMLEYLEETFPSPKHRALFPKDPIDRARARMFLSWYRCAFIALRDERATETIFYEAARAKKPLSQAAKEEVAPWMKALSDLKKPGSDFLFGDWSIADTETALMLHRLIANGEQVSPELKTYAEKLWKRPSMSEFVGHARVSPDGYYR